MVNLAQAWAEAYNRNHPEVSIQVSGGGSGVGIASLIEGGVDMANASRSMEEKEISRAETAQGKKPVEHTVAYDALAVYVHKDNPISSIALEELAEIYGDGGTITKWSQLSVKNAGCGSDEITRVGRQNSSGTYAYFREVVLGKTRDYKLGSIDQSGSKDVVALVANTPCAIGYSGMGYVTPEVKWLKVTKKKGETGVEPSVASTLDGTYPLARALYIYTLGEATGPAKEYLDWIMSAEGQKIVADLGYVPHAVAPAEPKEGEQGTNGPEKAESAGAETPPVAGAAK
jgi:phosphate transport system substrate-binding protein